MSDVPAVVFVECPKGKFTPVPMSAAGSSTPIEVPRGEMFWIHLEDPRERRALSVATVGIPPEPEQLNQPSRWDRPPLSKVRDTVREIEAGRRSRFAAPSQRIDE